MAFFPCFYDYCHDKHPLKLIFDDNKNKNKVKNLLSEILECNNFRDLRSKLSLHDLQKIDPRGADGKKVISLISNPVSHVYKLDYGNTPLRIYITTKDNIINIHIIDTKHTYFKKKKKKAK